MEDTNRVYRIRTAIGEDAPNVIHVPLNQSYDMFEILSLKLDQTNTYKTYESDYGVIVGRVTANGGFGVPNAKVSVFIEVSDEETLKNRFLYNYSYTSDVDGDGVRYNLLPDFVDDACHQDVGTFPNKRLVLDNQDVIEIFDKYWKYTTTTNHAGDYMLFGIPTGSQQLHVDVDLSDCGILSQRPRDMIGKGYNANMFESPNKFKYSTNLNSLAQIITQDRGVYVYPYWGDVSDGDDKFSITRCDINLEYKFESYAVFIGSIVTDKGSNAIGKNCAGTEQNGKMSDLIAGEGTIEMIRKTLDNKVEEFPIMGNRLIDGDGVWCYQIPMNLDYVTTDEFGNLVPTDNPDKGIATRTRVRFRISLDENPNDASARKRAKYLVPNNPRIEDEDFVNANMEPDYEFGSATREESYCDMFWNKVYSVKNYIPKLQKNNKETNRKHTGIKLINHYGDNNPMPYNALTIKLTFTYRLICVIVKIFILLIGFLNNLISILGYLPCWLGTKCLKIFKWKICPFKFLLKLIPSCISLSSEFCDDGINPNIYYPGCGKPFGCVWTDKTLKECQKEQASLPKEDQKICKNSSSELYTCVENELAQQNDATSFNFYNDWVNGVLYAPLWYRKITPKKRFFFGLFKRRAKDEWCSADRNFDSLRIMHTCSIKHDKSGPQYQNFKHDVTITPYYHETNTTDSCKKGECNKSITNIKGMFGVIRTKETMLGQTVYYYKPIEYDASLLTNVNLNIENKPQGEIKLLFASDIILLGSLNDCDINGIPQFFKSLESTTYDLPTDILFTDHEIINEFDVNGNLIETTYTETSEMAGCDWGNKNEYGKNDGGLFYSIGCSDITMTEKSCINLERICEFGVSLDETKQVPKLDELETIGDEAFENLVTDGFVSWDELYNFDERSMFATMNGNRLKTKLNVRNGLKEYDFRYLYPENFDGSLKNIMEQTTKKYNSEVTYRKNFLLEEFSRDYYIFRMGDAPYFYDKDRTFARYENSFYFYFGLKAGKTAIEKFNSKYFSECINPDAIESQIGIKHKANGWCGDKDGYLALDFSNISTPYNLLINSVTDSAFSVEIDKITEEKIVFTQYFQQLPQSLTNYVQIKGDESNGIYTYNENGSVIPMLENGSYQGVLTDNDGNITEFNFSINGQYLTFKTEVQHFKQPNNVLGDDYDAIANDSTGKVVNEDTKQTTRDIGGVISIYDIYMNGEKLDEYRVEINSKKPLSGYSGSTFNKSGNHSNGVIQYDTTNEIYGVGVGKGNVVYEVTVIQTCNGVDSLNVVKRNILVEEPIPYKMFINDVDYDLIKNFNKVEGEYSDGWIPSGRISDKMANLQNSDRTVIFNNNPWFNVDNIWSNEELYGEIETINLIEDISDVNTFIQQIQSGSYVFTTNNPDKTLTLTQILNEFTKVSVDNNVYYTWNGDYIVNDYNSSSFSGTYNEDNVYGLMNLVNEFIEKVNDVIPLRNELPSLVKSAFYLTCSNEQKEINVTVQTSDLPVRTTLVYQQETTPEDNDENVLTSDNMTITYESNIPNINIPTITYACNEKFGINGSTTYEPVVAQSGRYKKHAYYVGTMNDAKVSIPNGLSATQVNDIWQINENNNLSQLFDFPIIDKILNVNYISWAYMDKMPYYKKVLDEGYDIDTISMNGSFAAIVFNGNINKNNEFDTQTLCEIKLKLSENMVENQSTYVEKRIVLGYQNDETMDRMFGFTNYIVDENHTDNTQYAPLLPLPTNLVLEDGKGCGVSELIYGNMKVELTENSVNNCVTNEKILEVTTSNGADEMIYSVISLGENDTYPLNYIVKNENNLYVLNEQIKNLYSSGVEYNIFSFKMTSDYFTEGDNAIIDTDFESQLSETQDDGSVRLRNTRGYGSTGNFTSNKNTPLYIVAETPNHCRAISPVYDYSYVGALIKFGILKRKDVEITTDETSGEKTYTVLEPTEDYKFGIAVKKGHFYLDNYSYKLSGTCKIDSVNTIEVKEETLTEPNQFVFTSISQALYETLQSKFRSIIGQLLNDIVNNTTITAIDYTGLKHICGISSNGFKETRWYTYIWKGNLPLEEGQQPGIDTCGIRVNGEFLNETEFIYETDQNPTVPEMYVSPEFEEVFVGWCDAEDAEANTITEPLSPVTTSKVFYAKWNAVITHTVTFVNKNGQQISTQTVQHGELVTQPDGYDSYWYKDGDSTKAEVEFPYTVTRDITFKELNVFTVRWCQEFFNVKFYDSDEETPISQDYEKQVEKGELVTPPTGCEGYSWYVVGDVNKTEIDLNETPITQDISFAKYPTYTVRWVENDEE